MDLTIHTVESENETEASNKSSLSSDLDNQLATLLPQLRGRLQGDWNCSRTDDEFLAVFLRVKDYDVHRAAISVRDFYRNIERNHDLLCNICPSQFIPIFEMNFAVLLRIRATGTGSKVLLGNIRNWDTSKHTLFVLQQQALLQLFNILLQDKEVQLKGTALVFDLEGLSLSHLMQVNMKEVHRMLHSVHGGLPMKINAVHLINYPSIFFGFWAIVKHFIKAKLKKRFHFHKSLESFHEYFDREMLPTSLGGLLDMNEAVDQEFFEKMLKEDKCVEELYT